MLLIFADKITYRHITPQVRKVRLISFKTDYTDLSDNFEILNFALVKPLKYINDMIAGFLFGLVLFGFALVVICGVLWVAYMILYFIFAVIIGNLFDSDC